MEAILKILMKTNLENNNEFLEVKNLANEILRYLNISEVSEKIEKVHKVNAKSGEVQTILLEKMIELGFKSEKTGLFKKYKTKSLRPDYYKNIGQKGGVIIEVERGKTTANNMDMLDMWKCHICENANYLFLIIPQIRQTNKGLKEKIYTKVIDRLESFYLVNNYINVDAVFIFGY